MKLIISILFAILASISFSQQNLWLDISSHTSLKEASQLLKSNNYEIRNTSDWLHAISIRLNKTQNIPDYDFIENVDLVNAFQTQSIFNKKEIDSNMLSKNRELLKLRVFDSLGLTGKGVNIGIIDAGFENSDSTPYLNHLFKSKHIILHKDFVTPNTDDFYESKSGHDYHGRLVLSILGAKLDTLNGIAPDANYYLARTENGNIESSIEEDNWIKALEWMHINGVRLVNTSLGYSNMFDDSTENYIPAQMDGKSSRMAKAARIAVTEKNMILVQSTGNMGNHNDWRVVTTPADVKEIISVGATEYSTLLKQYYSSIGGDQLSYVKPDLVCFSPNGTSYSAPVITGMIACILQKEPSISTDRLKQLLFESCNLSPIPNDYVGRGRPDAALIANSLLDKKNHPTKTRHNRSRDRFEQSFHEKEYPIVVFHKKDDIHVVEQELIKKHKKKLSINRKELDESIKRSTIITATDKLIEVEWIH